MADFSLNVSVKDVMDTLPKLWQVNPTAREQFFNIILATRLEAAEARIAELEKPKGPPAERNGHAPASEAQGLQAAQG
jgi:hypothetical protein